MKNFKKIQKKFLLKLYRFLSNFIKQFTEFDIYAFIIYCIINY